MFWMCGECSRSVAETYADCPFCAEVKALDLALAKPVADRHDKGKTNFSHVDVFDVALAGVSLNAEYGASKYDLWNFMKGAKSALESYNCAQRHQKKWLNGEDLVPDAVEAGFDVHHIDAAIWNLMRLRQELVTFPERDNRPCKVRNK
mgnify:FL=1